MPALRPLVAQFAQPPAQRRGAVRLQQCFKGEENNGNSPVTMVHRHKVSGLGKNGAVEKTRTSTGCPTSTSS